MSIILDALKKAEKDRSQSETQPSDGKPPKPSAGLIADSPAKPARKFPVRTGVLVILVIISLLTFAAVRFSAKISPYVAYWKKMQAASKASTAANDAGSVAAKPAASPGASKEEQLQEKVAGLKAKAISLFVEGDIEKSLDQWKELAELAPTDAEVFNNLGVAYKKLGDKKKAGEAYGRALELDSDYPEALNNRGILYIEAFDYDEAKEDFSRAMTLDAGYAEPHFHLASLYEKEGALKPAVEHYESFLKMNPEIDADLKRKIDLRVDILKARLSKEN